MKNIKKKLAVSLLAISCVGISAGASVVAQNYSTQGITANAENCEEFVLGAVTNISGDTEVCLSFASGEAGQIDDMDCPLECVDGIGVTLNGVAVSADSLKESGDQLYITVADTLKWGDELKIGGEFHQEDYGVKYVINESVFYWDGSAWVTELGEQPETPNEPETPEEPEEPIEYTVYNVEGIKAESSSNASNVYIIPADGDGSSFGAGDWDNVYTFEAESGVGLKLNDTVLSTTDIKQPGSFFINLGVTAVEGDVLTIDGAYYNDTKAKKIVFNNCTLVFNGTTWVAESEEEPETPVEPEEPPVVEYTVYNINKLNGANGCSASVLYAYSTDGDAFPEGDWDNVYTFDAESGAGLKLNDTVLSTTDIKQPGDFFINLGVTAVEGDVLTIDGAYYNATTAKKFLFNNCTLVFNGTTWVAESEEEPETPVEPEEPPVVEYVTHEIGALILHVNSTVGGASGFNNTLYLQRADEEALPVQSWEHVFVLESGDGFRVNGEARTPSAIKSTGDGFYWEFAALNAGDVVSISGTFVCDTQAAKYVIEESKFVWNGTGWALESEEEPETPVEPEEPPVVEYTVYNINKLNGANGCSASVLYAYSTDGDAFPEGDWDNVYTFEAESGAGLKLNDTVLSTTDIKQPGDFFINLGVTAVEGDVLTIDGAYYNATTAKKFLFNNCTLVFNGTTWVAESEDEPETPVEPEEPPVVEYTVYNINKLNGANGCSASVLYAYSTDGDAFPEGDWDNVYTFDAESGAGLKLNDTVLSTTDIKQPGDFFINLGVTAVEGDVLTIDGAYYNATTAKKFLFNNCTLVFNGTTWVAESEEEPEEPPVVEYVTHEIGALILHINSTVGGASGFNNTLYLQRADEEALPVQSWDHVFVLESGDGFRVNGEVRTPSAIKSTGDGFYWEFAALNAGDVVSISGTFVCDTQAAKYVIEESKFVWNGTGWEKYVEYTTYEVGKVVFASASEGAISVCRADGEPFDIVSTENDVNWTTAFSFLAGSGVGITLNGVAIDMSDIKFPHDMYIGLHTEVNKDDVLVIGGTFYSPTLGVKYVIEESTMVYDGTTWLDTFTKFRNDKKAELDSYKATFAESDYYDVQWAELDTALENGKAAIDGAKTEDDVTAAVAAAKLAMDNVLTKTALDASLVDVKANAKADLAAYKAQKDYNDAEWTTIQGIVSDANAKIDNAKSEADIVQAVSDAKSAMDEVATAKEIADAQLKAWRTDAKKEVQDYYQALDLSQYTNEANATLSKYVAEARTAIDKATEKAKIDEAVATFKKNVDSVAKKDADNSQSTQDSSSVDDVEEGGCFSVAGGSAVLSALGLAAVVALRKKEEND